MLSFLIIQVAFFMTLGVTGECSWCPNQCVYCIRRLWVQFQSFILAGYMLLRFRYESWPTLVGSDSNEIFIFRASVLLLYSVRFIWCCLGSHLFLLVLPEEVEWVSL